VKKTVIIFVLVILAIVLTYFASNIPYFIKVAHQEGNPWVTFRAIISLNHNHRYARLSQNPEKYIMRSSDFNAALQSLCYDKDWISFEQLGAGIIFQDKNGKHILGIF
jgi:regulatory protein YycH of two-component signal transduction system YycFG